MPFMPFNILGMWFRGLLSIAIIVGGIYLLQRWYDDSHVIETTLSPVVTVDRAPEDGQRIVKESESARRVFRFEPGWNRPTAELAAAVTLLLWATVGRWVGQGVSMLFLRPGTNPLTDPKKSRNESASPNGIGREGDDDPQPERTGEVHTIRRPDGSELRVECYGPADAPPIVWTHGWGANSTEWYYQKRYLTDRFRLIVWDEPGMGLSKKPDNNDYRMENLAADLESVLAFAGRPAVLVGHSIGGMITLTFCKEYPEALGTRVLGLILAHTSYTNPVRTTSMASLYTAIEKPVLIPLMYLTIATWPVAWLLNWMSYVNGSAQRSTSKSSFAGQETRGQLDFCARFMPHARPDVLARGMLGMIAYDATHVLPTIGVPTLVVVGDKDSTTLPEAGQFIATNVANGRLATLSPAKHMGLIEHHDQFDTLVSEFVVTCQPSRVAS